LIIAMAVVAGEERHLRPEVLAQLRRGKGRQGAAHPADEVVPRRGHRARRVRDAHGQLGVDGVVDAQQRAGGHHQRHNGRHGVARSQAKACQVQHQQAKGAQEHLRGAETVLQRRSHEDRKDGDGDAPAEEHPADAVGIHAQDERGEGEHGEKAVVVEQPAGRRRP